MIVMQSTVNKVYFTDNELLYHNAYIIRIHHVSIDKIIYMLSFTSVLRLVYRTTIDNVVSIYTTSQTTLLSIHKQTLYSIEIPICLDYLVFSNYRTSCMNKRW